MAFGRHSRHQETHIIDETHIKHAVRLIQDNGLKVPQIQTASFNKVFNPPRSSDNKIMAAAQVFNLARNRHTAHGADGKDTEAGSEFCKLLIDLDCQLPRRSDNKHVLFSVFHRLFQKRKDKSGRLPRAGIGDADYVTALQGMRNGLVLNRRWAAVPRP